MQCEGCSRHSDEFSINQHNRNRRDDAESIKNLFHGINKSCAPLQKEMKHSSSSSSTTPISLSNNKFPAINLHRECVADPVSFKKKEPKRIWIRHWCEFMREIFISFGAYELGGKSDRNIIGFPDEFHIFIIFASTFLSFPKRPPPPPSPHEGIWNSN